MFSESDKLKTNVYPPFIIIYQLTQERWIFVSLFRILLLKLVNTNSMHISQVQFPGQCDYYPLYDLTCSGVFKARLSYPRNSENSDFRFMTFLWGFLFIMFVLLQFWVWIIPTSIEQKRSKSWTNKLHFGQLLIPVSKLAGLVLNTQPEHNWPLSFGRDYAVLHDKDYPKLCIIRQKQLTCHCCWEFYAWISWYRENLDGLPAFHPNTISLIL